MRRRAAAAAATTSRVLRAPPRRHPQPEDGVHAPVLPSPRLQPDLARQLLDMSRGRSGAACWPPLEAPASPSAACAAARAAGSPIPSEWRAARSPFEPCSKARSAA